MSYLVDSNVLLRLAEPSHPMCSPAQEALIYLRNLSEDLCILPQNLMEFWVVVTRPRASNGLGMEVDTATQELLKLKRLFILLPDTAEIFSVWEKLVTQHRVMGKPAHDARLVAAMKVHGVAQLLTFNTDDFKRYADIRAVDPRAVTTP